MSTPGTSDMRALATWLLTATAGAWVSIWAWCYPAAVPAIRETLYAERDSSTRARLLLLIHLPFIARAQAAAEQRPATRTVGSPASVVRHAGDRWREVVVVAVASGLATAAAAVIASFAATGDFLFEPHDPVTGVGQVSPYFRVAAAATLAAFALVLGAIAVPRGARMARRFSARR